MERRDDHLVLMRIIAILFSLAVMTEQMISAPAHLRCLILRLLRPAEALARELLADEADLRGMAGLPSPAFDGNGPEDALHLAWCFRALALALCVVLVRFEAFGASVGRAHAPSYGRVRSAVRPLSAAVSVFDTS